MLRVAVLVSGGGTNLQAIIDGVAQGTIGDTAVIMVISNKPGVYALERAEKSKIPGKVMEPKDYPDSEAYGEALANVLKEENIDLVVLAGFLVILPKSLIHAFPNRIINIHPSLIPAFCGKGFYGLKVHEAALARGVKVTGATVHMVDEIPDHGPILKQCAVLVQDNDTPRALQQRVMEEAEWKILPETIDEIAKGLIPIGEEA